MTPLTLKINILYSYIVQISLMHVFVSFQKLRLRHMCDDLTKNDPHYNECIYKCIPFLLHFMLCSMLMNS